MDTYYRLVNGELVDVSVQLFHYHGQLELERDSFKRRCKEFSEANEQNIIERDQWKRDAVEMARSIYQTGNGTISQRQVSMAKTIIDKAEGQG